jgi:hypothetical protein
MFEWQILISSIDRVIKLIIEHIKGSKKKGDLVIIYFLNGIIKTCAPFLGSPIAIALVAFGKLATQICPPQGKGPLVGKKS